MKVYNVFSKKVGGVIPYTLATPEGVVFSVNSARWSNSSWTQGARWGNTSWTQGARWGNTSWTQGARWGNTSWTQGSGK